MPSVCLYFQVHQPRRLRRYSFFDVGHLHDYEDEAENRRILERIALKCYLPANALLLELIGEYRGKFRVAFSLSGVLIDQLERYRPDVLESFRRLAETDCVEFLNETDGHSLAFLFSAAGISGTGSAAPGADPDTLRAKRPDLPPHRVDLQQRPGADGGRDGLQRHPCRGGRKAPRRPEPEPPLPPCRLRDAEAPPQELPPLGRRGLSLLRAELGRIPAHRGEVRPLAPPDRAGGGGDQPVHGLRNVRRASVGRNGDLRIPPGAARRGPAESRFFLSDPRRGGRRPSRRPTRSIRPASSPGRTRSGTRRPGWETPCSRMPHGRSTRWSPPSAGGTMRASSELAHPPDVRPFLLHVHEMVRRRRRPPLLQPLRIALRGLHQLHEHTRRS